MRNHNQLIASFTVVLVCSSVLCAEHATDNPAAATFKSEGTDAQLQEIASTARPLVIDEIAVSKAISIAEVAAASAEYHLANWKLQQLQQLQLRGHATWQEVAQHQTSVASLLAAYRSAKGHLNYVVDTQASITPFNIAETSADSSSPDTEALRLFIPGSSRLVGFLPAEQASSQLLNRHLENLKAELNELEQIDLAAFAKKTDLAVTRVAKLKAFSTNANKHLLNRAQAQAQLALAHHQLAVARKSYDNILSRRIAALEVEVAKRNRAGSTMVSASVDAQSVALYGTPLVDASNNERLQSLTQEIAELEASESAPQILKQLEAIQQDRLAKLELLSSHRAVNSDEQKLVRERLSDIQNEIANQQHIQQQQEQLAKLYSTRPAATWKSASEGPRAAFLHAFQGSEASEFGRDPSAVRHLLELHRSQTLMKAARQSAIEELSFRHNRLIKLKAIAIEDRRPKEVENARQTVALAKDQIAMISSSISLIENEATRFVAQFQAQHSDDFQLVQADGRFLKQSDLVKQEAMIAAVGFVGGERVTGPFGYLESPAIMSYLSALRTNTQPQLSATQTSELIANREFGFSTFRPGSRSSIWKTTNSTSGLRLATSGIRYPSDTFSFVPSGLWQLYPGYRNYGADSYRPFASDYFGSNFRSSSASAFQSRIPRYSDYYSFGIRRYDGPAGSKFKRGSRAFTPFFIPGSPTNFRF